MKRQIEQEIDLTLNCLNEFKDIQVSPVFMDTLSGKISHLQMHRNIGYQSGAFYPVVIMLLVVMNIAILVESFGKQRLESGQYDQTGIMVTEYGMGQNSYTAF